MIRAIIFDAYGTLISTGKQSIMATEKILKKVNVDMDAKLFYKKWQEFRKKQMSEMNKFKPEAQIFEDSLKMLYEYYGIESNYKEDVQIIFDTFGKRKAFEETNEVLEKLSKKYKIYIGSTTDTTPLIKDIQNNEMKLDGIFTSESLKTYKPHKEFYVQILHKIDLTSDEVVFVGDSMENDVIGPQSVGIKAILIDRKGKYNAEERKIPSAVISNLRELEDVI